MRLGLHIEDVVGEPDKFAEAGRNHGFDRRFSLSIYRRLQLGEATMAGKIDDFFQQRIENAHTSEIGMSEEIDFPDMTFPPTGSLMQSSQAGKTTVDKSEQGKVLAEFGVIHP